MGNEYRLKSCEALRLKKQMWLIPLTLAISERLTIKRYTNEAYFTFTFTYNNIQCGLKNKPMAAVSHKDITVYTLALLNNSPKCLNEPDPDRFFEQPGFVFNSFSFFCFWYRAHY